MAHRDPAAGLGRTQRLVLQQLRHDPKSVRALAMGWPGLTEASVRTALTGLERRGLVDRLVHPGGVYKFSLTDKGREVLTAISFDGRGEEA